MTARGLGLLPLVAACGDSGAPPASEDRSRFVGCAADLTVDDLDDGAIDDAERHEYDGFGFLAWQETDYGADGAVDEERSDWNDRFGNAIESRYDGTGDGFADWLQYGEYDADGNPLRVEVDQDGDLTVDSVNTYEVVGGLVRTGTWEDGEGNVLHEYTWEYDGLGREILQTTVDPTDDRLLWEETATWLGATEVAIGSTFTEYSLGGEVFRTITWDVEVDAQLRVLGYHMVDLVQGQPNATVDRTYTYEGDFEEPASSDEASTSGGEPWYAGVRTLRYDGARRVVEQLYVGAVVDGGDLTARTSLDWSCP